MQQSSLSGKEEKAALTKIKKLKEEHRKTADWNRKREAEMDGVATKRASAVEQLRAAYEQQDAERALAWRAGAARALSLGAEQLCEARVPATAELQELLGTAHWKQLLAECPALAKMERGENRAILLAGPEDGVEKAQAKIGALGQVAVLRREVGPEEQALLFGRRGATIAQLQVCRDRGLLMISASFTYGGGHFSAARHRLRARHPGRGVADRRAGRAGGQGRRGDRRHPAEPAPRRGHPQV